MIAPPIIEWIEGHRLWAVFWRDDLDERAPIGVIGNYPTLAEAEAAAIEAVMAEEALADG